MSECIHRIPKNIEYICGGLEFSVKGKVRESAFVYYCSKCSTYYFSSPYKLPNNTFEGNWENVENNQLFEADNATFVRIKGKEETVELSHIREDAEEKSNIVFVKNNTNLPQHFEYFNKSYGSNWVLYGLQLADKCYYIGRTQSFERRMQEHFSGNGASFTKKHKPYRILFAEDLKTTNDSQANFHENQKTLEFMTVFGRDKVQGGDYCDTSVNVSVEKLYRKAWTRECGFTIRVMLKKHTKQMCKTCKTKLISTYVYYPNTEKNKISMLSAWYCPKCSVYYIPKHEYERFPYKESMSIVNNNGKVITHDGSVCKKYSSEKCMDESCTHFGKECVGYCECDKFLK